MRTTCPGLSRTIEAMSVESALRGHKVSGNYSTLPATRHLSPDTSAEKRQHRHLPYLGLGLWLSGLGDGYGLGLS